MKKEYLSEENYQNTKKKIGRVGKIVLACMFILSLSLIGMGIFNIVKYNDKDKLAEEEAKLVEIKEDLKDKIAPVQAEITKLERVPFDGFNDEYYAREDRIAELKKSISEDNDTILLIEEALNDNFEYCAFDKYQKNEYTSEYCKYDYVEVTRYMVFFIPGIMILFITLSFSSMLFMVLKRREIMAYGMQEVNPLVQEGIEKIAVPAADKMMPTLGKAAKSIAKGIKEGIEEEK